MAAAARPSRYPKTGYAVDRSRIVVPLRPAPGKDKARVFDYIDIHVPTLVNAANARRRVYQRGPEKTRVDGNRG